jgi:hypothetical protein
MLSRAPFWSASRRAVLLGLLAMLTFLSWKHGYVRVDTHIIMFLGFTSVVGLAFEALTNTSPAPGDTRDGMESILFSSSVGRLQTAARVGSVTICLLASATLHWMAPTMYEGRFDQAFNRISNNLRALLSPSWYQREIANARAASLQRYELPKLRHLITTNGVDIFGQNQLYAMLNDLRFRPRPVFQSYCAYTPYLASMNERFYAGTSAPEFVLFDLVPLDQRLPSLEDSKVFRRLLTQYQFIDSEATFLLLKRTHEEAPSLDLQLEGTACLGERINLPAAADSDLVMQIDLRASVSGKLRQFFYQPPKVYLLCQTNLAGEGLKFEAPTPMLASGFVICPLLRNRTDVQEYLEGKRLLAPVAMSVELAKRDEMFYRQPFHYSISGFRLNRKEYFSH